MKKLSFLMLFLFLGACVFAQDSDRYRSAMKKNLAKLDTAHSIASLTAIANSFERISKVKSDQWLPYYYAGLCRIRTAFMQKNKDQIDPIADEVEKLADKADQLNPNKAEMLCLRSMIASARIQVDPRDRGAQYGPLSSQYLEKAKKLAPDNPRVYLLLGQAAFYTPKMWGGGKDKAIPLLKKAMKKFKSFKPANDLAPDWGEKMTQYLLTKSEK